MNAPRIFTPEYYARMRELESRSWWSAAMRDVAARWLEGAALPATGLLLDLGCGSGQTISWFETRYPRWRAIGLDVARDAALAAQGLLPGQVALASALAVPLADHSVDLIITLDVLQHLPLGGGDRRAIVEMHRVLRPGGFLLIRTNSQVMPHVPDDQAHAYHRYEPAELRTKLTEAGFRVRRIGRVNALLGLAEIPRELRARRLAGSTYHGLLSTAHPEARWLFELKRAWLGLEGRLVALGFSLPLGRTILALCQAPHESSSR